MTISIAQFRSDFPEFADDAVYTDSSVTFWIELAGSLMTGRWGSSAIETWPVSAPFPKKTLYDSGMELFVAHNLSLQAVALSAVEAGGIPGGSSGPANSKSVDKVSVGYDAGAVTLPGAGEWNSTSYGRRFWWIARMVGAGPIQVNTPGDYPTLSGQAWPGPFPFGGT